jgi:hypothetical protein
MQQAIVVKELRESAGLVVLAVLGMAYALADLTATPLTPWQSRWLYSYPVVADSLEFYFWIVAGGLAIAVGLRQTAWELNQGTYFFLLHRPLSRRRIFALKLLVGGTIVMLLASAMIAIYVWWAATPGHFAAPFYWTMTEPAWQLLVSLPPLYLGAFLAGIRPGRWFGSRLVPLVAGLLAAIGASHMAWFWQAAAISFVASMVLVVAIYYYIEARDY